MGKIDYRRIYNTNKDEWKALTREPQKYEALLAGHYSDSNHFVYELLQNAEDESADLAVFEYYDDKLIFYHNGTPFDEADVRGVSSMLMGTKDRNSAQTIGRFGMGFKSVFKYTYQPEIYSDEEAFRIENYLLPVEIETGWDFQRTKKELVYPLGDNRKYYPFANQQHLTKFVIPFAKRRNDGTIEPVPGKDVLQKLQELSGEILLFLNHIRKLYWINKENNRFAMITLDADASDPNLVTCHIEGSQYGKKEEITRYLKFKKIFDHPDMKSAEVSVAYKVNARANNINDIQGLNPVWVYFPTRDNTDLPFMIHGSFETAVSREKLMSPSAFNDDLFEQLGNLICDSMDELKRRNLITQVFLRRIILTAFKDEAENNTIPGLKEKLTKTFREGSLLPDKDGVYRAVSELSIPVPFGIAEFYDSPLFTGSFSKAGHFLAYNNERELNFTEYLVWVADELKMKVFSLAEWANGLYTMQAQTVPTSGGKYDALEAFYDFLSDNRESLYSTKLTYSRSGRYEQTIRNCVAFAWKQIRKAPLVLNATGELHPAYKNDEQVLYLSSTSDYKDVLASSIVHRKVADKFPTLFKDGFQITSFDNYQYVKEKVIQKYINGERVGFENPDDFAQEYFEDLEQILELLENNADSKELLSLLRKASIIKIKTDNDVDTFAEPQNVYLERSEEGIDLLTYYAKPALPEQEEEDDNVYWNESFEDIDLYCVDTQFYQEHNFSLSRLAKLGLVTSPITEGIRSQAGGPGVEYWVALGEYCPHIDIDYLDLNLGFIQENPTVEISRRKSVEIYKLLLSIRDKLSGTVRHRKVNPYQQEEKAYLLRRLSRYAWLYDKQMKIHAINEMSKYDLAASLYGQLIDDKDAYVKLGFIETEDDTTADAFEQVGKLDKRDKKILLRQLAKELGMKISDGTEEDFDEEDEEEGTFDPNAWMSEEFPVSRVRNMDSLVEHVKQQFFCADPVTYQKVLRQIRTSKSKRTVHAYVKGMYQNESDVQICQMCKKPADFVDVTEIANFGIELPQLHLCLCRNCASKYKMFRDVNKDRFKDSIRQAIQALEVSSLSDEEYEVGINGDTSIFFTQTHVAEVQTIFSLLSEFGTPVKDGEQSVEIAEEKKTEPEGVTSGPLQHRVKSVVEQKSVLSDGTIKDGDFVSYKKLNTLEIMDTTIQASKYELHRRFLGKKVGDVVMLMGKKYEIISIV